MTNSSSSQSMRSAFQELVPVESLDDRYRQDITEERFYGAPLNSLVEAERRLLDANQTSIAYFSMEYGLSTTVYHPFESVRPVAPENFFNKHYTFSNMRVADYYLSIQIDKRLDLPIYSGGLGVLAGDTLKSLADAGISAAGIGVLWHRGYFKQNFWFKDGQIPEEMYWDPGSFPGLVPLTHRVSIAFREQQLTLKLWKYFVYSHDWSHVVPLVLLDADLPENDRTLRALTSQLYRSDNAWWKLMQRAILGLGGIEALKALGYAIDHYHLNEGHAALAFPAKVVSSGEDPDALRRQFVYTCHTPVAAGHDRFDRSTVEHVLPKPLLDVVQAYGADPEYGNTINLTQLAMNTCDRVNAVSQKHGEITRLQFPRFASKIQAITNGVHHHTWTSAPIARVLDAYQDRIGPWRSDPLALGNLQSLAGDQEFRRQLWDAHQQNKQGLCDLLRQWKIRTDVLTVAWARRMALYKRPSLLLQDIRRLRALAEQAGPIQILYAGKAHPNDTLAFEHIREMMNRIDALHDAAESVRIVMLENYDTYFAQLLVSSVDVWLNNPLPPFEASGTSGMKAIMNGVLQMSTLDGWVLEATQDDIGWFFGWRHDGAGVGSEGSLRLEEDAAALYDTLAAATELYYRTNQSGRVNLESAWIDKMICCLAVSGRFSTHRMVQDYAKKIWGL